jgi:hypothetical protein
MIAIGLLFVRMLCDFFKPRPRLEAEILIPTDKSDHMFLLRWRDFPQVPTVTRPRWALGLLYPNGR